MMSAVLQHAERFLRSECIEVTIVVIFTLFTQFSTPIELAYITPFTAQVASIGVTFYTRRRSTEMGLKHVVDHLLYLS